MTVQNPEKLYELIKQCNLRRLTTEESLEFIKQNGIDLSERTYRRYKKELEDNNTQRILQEGEIEFHLDFTQNLDTVKQIQKELWKIFSNTNNEVLKVKLLRSIQDVQDKISDQYLSLRRRTRVIRDDEKKQEEKLQREANAKWSAEQEQENPLEITQ